jgi:hypothetical protein
MLDVDVLSNEEERLQIISTLQSSPEGLKAYEALCEKLVNFSTIHALDRRHTAQQIYVFT